MLARHVTPSEVRDMQGVLIPSILRGGQGSYERWRPIAPKDVSALSHVAEQSPAQRSNRHPLLTLESRECGGGSSAYQRVPSDTV